MAAASVEAATAHSNGISNGSAIKGSSASKSIIASKGPGLNHQALISESSLRRPQSPIRSLFPAESIPGMISFLAGKPNATTFPFANISMTLKSEAEAGTSADGTPTQLTIEGDELNLALQYGLTPGLPPFKKWLTEFQSRYNNRPIVNPGDAVKDGQHPWTVHVGNGSQDLLSKVFNTLLNPGDSCLVERPVYAGVMPNLVVLESDIVAVEADEEGMSPVSLENILANWTTAEATKGKKFPKFVLTTPTGANPSGTTASEQRKRDVLRIIRQYGILLIEDDPYLMLAFKGLGEDKPETRKRCRTYWSLENDDAKEYGTGWVVRVDSFSKVLSAGIRMGFMTGPPTIMHYIESETAVINLQASGVAQIITFKLLQFWGYEGFLRHADATAEFYRKRRDNFEMKARKVLGEDSGKGQKSVATWITPVAGMFLWLRLKLPPSVNSAEGDSFALIREKAHDKGVLAVPGMSFMPDGKTTCYVRTSFSLIPEEDVEEGLSRLRAVIEEAWKESGQEMPA
ncbi:PLP-dependent transferase [Meira miltonrushii]|uniref:PLP-dependent transferase n=1 Tax=Meira miltonrushii TaxID=1280837 RepID=A0A316VR67_9BASI|nr:PLP-dependent transferase [Meira miltonrushii]PWN37995.1 PLP-dependent transferase [Meira miltonrushii]